MDEFEGRVLAEIRDLRVVWIAVLLSMMAGCLIATIAVIFQLAS